MDFGNFDIFAAKDDVGNQERVLSLDPHQVYPDPGNVRRAIEQTEIDGLAETIAARGQLQPIIVAPADDDGRYRIQFGERRWRACLQLGRPVQAIVREMSDPDQLRVDQFIENDQREDLSVRDMIAFVADQVAGGRSIADLARGTGRDRARLSRLHSLATAPDFIVARLDDLPIRGAVALMNAAAHDEAGVRLLLDRAPVGSLTIADCEAFARRDTAARTLPETQERVSPAPTPAASASLPKDPKQSHRAPVGSSVREQTEAVRFIDIDGKRARLIEAVVQFEGEDQARTVQF
ncbi:hypothetical protein CAF53_23060 [Sphingobium sp. LB126]|uniref:ParB/RepB/Spo0J family partition protein n=1 Tax=Sphingobium sp. LB126 TaxID=1983755 RepID=UPI000C207DE7|nr:ParB/RepB/Spo0J family partition protein [Sphingobium sp. LB126]PJG45606.1 hypothetical protein CAF53_23060 [Sphingobium sp. LB126]